ncbi:MAG: hypothetical protein ACYTGE_09970 [Planctomycetota bacterium]|jgi:hypothetical protein
MNIDLSILQLRTWVRSLTMLVADRARRETAIEQRHRTDTDAIRREDTEAREQLESRHRTDTKISESDYHAEQARIRGQFTSREQQTRTARDVEHEKILEKGQHSEGAAQRKLEEAIWAAETVYEAKEGQPDKQYHQRCAELNAKLGALEATEKEARALLKRTRQRQPAPVMLDDGGDEHALTAARHALHEHATTARARLHDLDGLFLPRLFTDIIPFVLVLLPPAAVVALAGLTRGWRPDTTMLVGAGIALGLGIGVMAWLYVIARSRTRAVCAALGEALARGHRVYEHAHKEAEEERDREQAELVATRDREVLEAKEKYEPILAEIRERREHHLARIRDKYPALLTELHERCEQQLQENRRRYEAATTSAAQDYEQKRLALETRHAEHMEAIETRYREGRSDQRPQRPAVPPVGGPGVAGLGPGRHLRAGDPVRQPRPGHGGAARGALCGRSPRRRPAFALLPAGHAGAARPVLAPSAQRRRRPRGGRADAADDHDAAADGDPAR